MDAIYTCNGPVVKHEGEFLGRKGCGNNVTKLINDIPADGKEHKVECPVCKTVGTHRKTVALSLVLALLVGFTAVFSPMAWAQGTDQPESIAVPFDTAKFYWDVEPGYMERFGPAAHVITCGPYTKRVEMPATSVFVKDVVPEAGRYTCTIYGTNRFGVSAAPDPQFPIFEAGVRPFPPVNLRLEIR